MPFLNLSSAEFAPLFQLLDNYEPHRTCPTKSIQNTRPRTRTFYAPAFDVREVSDSYYLDGELPGVDQDAIDIEFRDSQTLVIKGRSERNYQTTQPETPSDTESSESPKRLRQPTVEDEDESDSNDSDTNTATSMSSSGSTKTPAQTPSFKYWVSERSIGDFERTFSFPTRVDQDAVRASLKNGVLSVVVPKEATPKAKKIRVE
ncbi:hypothetical protein N7488_004269 [Penicillium malachiteum]|nr:hypothetical protein N7488_004269 [Penicillium malachiteum]